jgi:outer membrane protein OmpU
MQSGKTMKTKYYAGLMVLLTGGAAHAQSSISLYGVIDDGLTFVNNYGGHAAWRMEDSISQGDRFGFRGSEDLGGGISAIFNLENGFNPNTGALRQGGLEFGRQAWVGLEDKRLGTVKFGRTFDQMTTTLLPFHTGYYAGIYTFDVGDHDRISGSWLNNVVTYVSPDLGGVRLTAQYSFNSLSSTSNNYGPAFSLGALYTHGNFSVGVAMTNVHDYTVAPGTSLGLPRFLGQNVVYTSQLVTVDRYRTAGIGGAYSFGTFGISGVYTNTRYQSGVVANTMQSLNSTFHFNVRPDTTLAVGLSHSTFSQYKWNELDFSADYLFSKRTDVIASLDCVRASGGAHAGLVTLTPSSNSTQLAARLAMRHRF